MKCFEIAQNGIEAGGCSWVAEDTFGMVVAAPLTDDVAQITRDVRLEIEN
jgi:hypothetical protein